jgi:SAM-dependent methyltransferase
VTSVRIDDDRATGARRWITRWDRQQEGFRPEREAQFTALIDAVEEAAGRPDPLVVDLGSGPGAIGARLLARLPGATVVSVDADPLLIELGRAAHGDLPGLRFVDADLRRRGWPDALGLDRPADAVVSATALHWLAPAVLALVYADAARLLRPGGLLVNGDELPRDRQAAPVLARIERALHVRERARRSTPDQSSEGWHEWWDGVSGDPLFAAAVAEGRRRGYDSRDHADLSTELSAHLDVLRAAGFREIGTIWQRGEDRLLCAIAGPDAG